jgi:hypothetical protein
MKTSLLASGLLVLAIESPMPAVAEDAPPPTILTFDDTEVGLPPSGFTTALTGGGGPVSWLVQDDPTAPSGERVLMQTSADTTGSRFPLCIYDTFSSEDVRLSVKFKAVSGTIDQAAGLVWRYQNPSSYYVLRANALEGNVVLYKVENGKRSDLQPIGSGLFAYGKDAEVQAERWQTLEVEVKGARFRVMLDDVHLFDVEDSTFRAAGKVGVWTKADSVTAFDDFNSGKPASKDASPIAQPSPP